MPEIESHQESTAISVPGACLCGAVRFEVQPESLFCGHCHCSICRRSHGASFVTWFGILKEHFRLTAGSGDIVRYHSSEHGVRSFCGRCGSSLFFESSTYPERIDVALASMQGAIDRRPEFHVHFDDRASWTVVADSLLRLGGPSGLEPLESPAKETGR